MANEKGDTLNIDDISPDDVLTYMYDTGAFGYQICYVRVLKVKKLVKVRFETGREVWKRLSYFDRKLSSARVAELQDDGVVI